MLSFVGPVVPLPALPPPRRRLKRPRVIDRHEKICEGGTSMSGPPAWRRDRRRRFFCSLSNLELSSRCCKTQQPLGFHYYCTSGYRVTQHRQFVDTFEFSCALKHAEPLSVIKTKFHRVFCDVCFDKAAVSCQGARGCARLEPAVDHYRREHEVAEMSTFADAPKGAATTSATGSLRGSSTNGGTAELAEDGYPKDMEIPIRYVKGMEGDMVEARRRWIATLQVCTHVSCTPLCPSRHNRMRYTCRLGR